MIERHQCEVRAVLAMRAVSQDQSTGYLVAVKKARGSEAAEQLKRDCATQWGMGNRGKWGDWK